MDFAFVILHVCERDANTSHTRLLHLRTCRHLKIPMQHCWNYDNGDWQLGFHSPVCDKVFFSLVSLGHHITEDHAGLTCYFCCSNCDFFHKDPLRTFGHTVGGECGFVWKEQKTKFASAWETSCQNSPSKRRHWTENDVGDLAFHAWNQVSEKSFPNNISCLLHSQSYFCCHPHVLSRMRAFTQLLSTGLNMFGDKTMMLRLWLFVIVQDKWLNCLCQSEYPHVVFEIVNCELNHRSIVTHTNNMRFG